MKKQLFCILCLATIFNCTYRKEFDFEINVEHWYGEKPINRLIVTNHSGEIVKVFENAPSTYKVRETRSLHLQ